jgi:hypothetical protein
MVKIVGITAILQSLEFRLTSFNPISCGRPLFPIIAAYNYKHGLPPETFIFQICKWIHGVPADPENVCFRLSDNFVMHLGFPDRTWTPGEWEYGIVTITGIGTDRA